MAGPRQVRSCSSLAILSSKAFPGTLFGNAPVVNQRLKGNGLMWCEGNAEGMLQLRAAALTGRWDEMMERAQESKWKEGKVHWHWSSPDMPFQLNAQIEIKPPVPQPQDAKRDRRIPA